MFLFFIRKEEFIITWSGGDIVINNKFNGTETIESIKANSPYTEDETIQLIESIKIPQNQAGGSQNQEYHKKYLKYKSKYMQLKTQ